jgi:phosphoribosylanthranilate isomerase
LRQERQGGQERQENTSLSFLLGCLGVLGAPNRVARIGTVACTLRELSLKLTRLNRTRIKICGITRAEDALTAARAGADAIGLVFYPGAKRCISIERAREILRALPPFVTPVGLFVDQSIDEVRSTASALGLRHLQFNGHEEPRTIAELKEFVIIKAVRVARDSFAEELARWRETIARHSLPHLRGLVLETASAHPGGSGMENDWEAVHQAIQQGAFAGLPPIIAAGGLTPTNVADVVRRISPWAVDVSSGVEESFGIKSAQKIEAFVKAVRETE